MYGRTSAAARSLLLLIGAGGNLSLIRSHLRNTERGVGRPARGCSYHRGAAVHRRAPAGVRSGRYLCFATSGRLLIGRGAASSEERWSHPMAACPPARSGALARPLHTVPSALPPLAATVCPAARRRLFLIVDLAQLRPRVGVVAWHDDRVGARLQVELDLPQGVPELVRIGNERRQ